MNLRRWLIGRRIATCDAEAGKPLRDLDPATLARGVEGRSVIGVRRVGKQLLIDLDDDSVLLAHLGMTGKFVPESDEPRPGTRIRLGLSDGARIAFIDTRRFGRIRLAPDVDAAAAHPELARLGPDALELCRRPGGLASVLKGRRRPIKPALMDQSLLAGVGNIYAAEGLFAGRVHPLTRCDRVGRARYQAVADGIVAAMEATLVRDLGDEINYLQEKGSQNPFTVYGRAGEPCRVCGTLIERTVQSGRSTFWCPRCQPR